MNTYCRTCNNLGYVNFYGDRTACTCTVGKDLDARLFSVKDKLNHTSTLETTPTREDKLYELLGQCTLEQQLLFKLAYPKGIENLSDSQFERAIRRVKLRLRKNQLNKP